jgi:restriction system protein
MKLKMAENSLFAILLRSPWWISIGICLALGAVGVALLPERFRVVGALSGLPFGVIGVVAAMRQRHLPSAALVDATRQSVAAMAWPAFATLLAQAFEREGYAVERTKDGAYDFELQRQGRRTLVAAKRWKSARTGLETLRALQAAREKADVSEAIVVSLGELTETAVPFAKQHGIVVWQAPELAKALRGLTLPGAR